MCEWRASGAGRNRLVMVRKGLLPRVQTTAVSASTQQEKEAAEMAVANLSFPVDEHAEEVSKKPVNAFVEQIVNERRTQASRQSEAGGAPNVPFDGRPDLQYANSTAFCFLLFCVVFCV
jgi:hypothetical protein